MSDLDELLEHLERLAARVDELPDEQRADVLGLVEGLDLLHRSAVEQLASALGEAQVETLGQRHPAIHWLFATYAARDGVADAEAALDSVRPFIQSHGGDVEVLDVRGGVVTVRLSGACSGCTASAITLRHGVEEALTEQMPGFTRLEVVEDEAATPHPPPGATLLDQGRSLPIHPG